MSERHKACAFTGHRPQRLAFGFDESDPRCLRVKRALRDQIIRSVEAEETDTFISGMAQGVDLWAAEIVLDLKKEGMPIRLECAIPCDTQTKNWPDDARERYERVLDQADEVTYVQHKHTKDCFLKRDRYMVDQADRIIAVWNGTRSGTGYTVEYAQQQNVPVVVIDPDTARVRSGERYSL